MVEDVAIPRSQWDHLRPKMGSRVTINVVPQGGGGEDGEGDKSVIQIVAVIAIAVAAIYFPPLAAGAAGGAGTAAGAAAYVATAVAISVVGGLILQALAPPPPSQISRSSFQQASYESYAAVGSRNQLQPFGAIPKIFGKHRIYPQYAAQVYSEVVAQNIVQFRAIYMIGIGDYNVEDLRIGSTSLDEFEGVEWHLRRPGDNQTIYPGDVDELGLQIPLRDDTPVTESSGAHIRTTAPSTDRISIDISFGALYAQRTFGPKRGFRDRLVVKFRVRYRAPGGSWILPAFDVNAETKLFGCANRSRSSVGILACRSNQPQPQYASASWDVPRGQYEVQIERVETELPPGNPFYVPTEEVNESQIWQGTISTSSWAALRSIRFEPPVSERIMNLTTRVEIVVQGSDQLNGVVDTFNLIVRSILPVWDGATITYQETRNAAWAYLDTCTSAMTARPLDASIIDLDGLKAWADSNEAAGRYYDSPITARTTMETLLSDIAGSARASLQIQDGRYGVVHDVPKTTVVQHFTPRNSRAFSGTRVFQSLPHAVRVNFTNAEANYTPDQLHIYLPGYTAATAVNWDRIDLPGITDPDTAQKEALYHIATASQRPEIYSLTVDWENLVCTRGDLVRVTHDVPLFGRSGTHRIKALTTTGSGVDTITLDEPVEMSSGETYTIRIRLAQDDFRSITATPTNLGNGFFTVLSLSPEIPNADAPSPDDLVMFGLTEKESVEMIVTGIDYRQDASAVMRLIDYAPTVYDADTAFVPFNSQTTAPVPQPGTTPPPLPVVQSISSSASVLETLPGGGLQERIIIRFLLSSGRYIRPDRVEATYRIEDTNEWRRATSDDPTFLHFPAVGGETYEIGVRYSAYGVVTEWVYLEPYTVIGQTEIPPDVINLRQEGNFVNWDYPLIPPDLHGFIVRYHFGDSLSWTTATRMHPPDDPVHAPFALSSISGDATILVKAVDFAGNESNIAATVDVSVGTVDIEHELQRAELAPGWSGSTFWVNGAAATFWVDGASAVFWSGSGVMGGTINGSNQLQPNTTSVFWVDGQDAVFWTGDPSNTWWDANYTEMTFVAAFTPIRAGRMVVQVEGAFPQGFGLKYRNATQGTSFADWPGQLQVSTDSYEIKLIVYAGKDLSLVDDLKIILDTPEISETVTQSISSLGTVLSLGKTYTEITSISGSASGTAGGVAIRAINYTASGPTVEVLNASGTAVTETATFHITGYV